MSFQCIFQVEDPVAMLGLWDLIMLLGDCGGPNSNRVAFREWLQGFPEIQGDDGLGAEGFGEALLDTPLSYSTLLKKNRKLKPTWSIIREPFERSHKAVCLFSFDKPLKGQRWLDNRAHLRSQEVSPQLRPVGLLNQDSLFQKYQGQYQDCFYALQEYLNRLLKPR